MTRGDVRSQSAALDEGGRGKTASFRKGNREVDQRDGKAFKGWQTVKDDKDRKDQMIWACAQKE